MKRNVPPVHLNNMKLPQEEDVKCLGLHFDRRFIWHKHIFAKRKQLGIALTKMCWLLGRKPNLSLRNTTLGYGFHFQHRNSRTFPIESLVHDSGRTFVCAEYGYPKGSPNTNSLKRNPTLQLSIQCPPQHTSRRLNSEPHGATRQQQAIAKTLAKLSAYQIPNVIVVFVVLVFKV
jgi:uncharacterized Zn-finger protein